MRDKRAHSEHPYCRLLWKSAKRAAMEADVTLPIKMTAMRGGQGVYYVQGLDDEGAYVDACCAFEAKAKRIMSLIEAAAPASPHPLA